MGCGYLVETESSLCRKLSLNVNVLNVVWDNCSAKFQTKPDLENCLMLQFFHVDTALQRSLKMTRIMKRDNQITMTITMTLTRESRDDPYQGKVFFPQSIVVTLQPLQCLGRRKIFLVPKNIRNILFHIRDQAAIKMQMLATLKWVHH